MPRQNTDQIKKKNDIVTSKNSLALKWYVLASLESFRVAVW